MPEEAQKKSSEELIDVGETVGAEINLDDKGEPEKVEAPKVEKIEVEQVPEDKSFGKPWKATSTDITSSILWLGNSR